MGMRLLSLLLPIVALFAIGSATAAPNLLARWQMQEWSQRLEARVGLSGQPVQLTRAQMEARIR